MTNQSNADALRKELKDLAFLQNLVQGERAKKALHDRMLTAAFQLQEATS